MKNMKLKARRSDMWTAFLINLILLVSGIFVALIIDDLSHPDGHLRNQKRAWDQKIENWRER